MNLKETLKKQGGIKLIKQYWQGGAFFTAVGELLLLGKSRTALEILRLAAQYKIKNGLEKEYKHSINEFQSRYVDDKVHETSNKVWVCWFQGLNSAPELVKRCFQSLKDNLTDRDIILITSENMCDYVNFPDYILAKWKSGQITHTHMTDLLRLELLIKYGGMWIDATVLCTRRREDIPDYFFNSDLFFYQILKPGRDGQALPFSSWLISAKTNNKILMMTRYLCYEYWQKNNEMVDYYLFHYFVMISLEHNEEEWNKIIPRDNAASHILLLRLFDKYDEILLEAIKDQTPFHKLTYKYERSQIELPDTFFSKLFL